jgi:small subunit ribosomal protein S1
MKQIEEDPWHTLPEKYPIGTRLEGKVRNLTSFGAFVEIEPGIDGLVHISDMSWTKRIQHPSEVVRKGDDVSVLILGVDADNKRISLGLKQTQEDPWAEIAQEYTPGTPLNGTIARLQDKGVAVDLGNDLEGFVPLSQIGVTGLQNPADLFAEGDELEMEVSEVDPDNRRIVLNVTRIPKLENGEIIRPVPPVAAEAEGVEAPEATAETEDVTEPVAEAAAEPVVEAEAEADAIADVGDDPVETAVAEADPASRPPAIPVTEGTVAEPEEPAEAEEATEEEIEEK